MGVLCFCIPTLANDLTATWTQTFTTGDTLGWRDSVYSEWVPIHGATKFHFYAQVLPYLRGGIDTNFAADSFYIGAQLSFNKIQVTKTLELDTFLTTDSGWTGLLTSDGIAADSLRGNYMRLIGISVDTVNIATSGAIVGKTYAKLIKLFYAIIK